MTQHDLKDEVRKFLRSSQEKDDIMQFLIIGRTYLSETNGFTFKEIEESVQLALAEEENELLKMELDVINAKVSNWEEPDDYDQVVNGVQSKCRCGKDAIKNCEETFGAMTCQNPVCGTCACKHKFK